MSDKEAIRERIIEILTDHSPRLLKTNELSKELGIPASSGTYELVRHVLDELQDQSIIFKGPRRRYGKVVPDTSVTGRIKMIDSGRWELIPEGASEPVLKFDRDEIWTAFHGDLVKARPLSSARAGEIPWGEVTRVVERKTDRIVGSLRQGRALYLQPDSKKIHRTITVPRRYTADGKIGDKVVVELLDWKDPDDEPSGKVVRKIGRAGEISAELRSLKEEFDIRIGFPDEVETEAESYPSQLRKSDLKGRKDLRDQPIFTIDPEDAKDFDDAISIRTSNEGNIVVGIHIADVGHYVKEGSALDTEAFLRGTSIYLVNEVIPMLPERLSNDICSLKPDVDRLAFSIEVTLSPRGAIKDYEIFKSVIRSQRRFTYDEALRILNTGEGDFAEDLAAVNKIAKALRRNRIRKGSIDFVTTELKFRFDEDDMPVEVIPKRANEATRLIEDCMLLANRIVAEHIGKFRHLNRKKRGGDKNPFLYRIHDVPPKEKLIDLARFVKTFGYSIPVDNIKPKDIQRLVREATERGHEDLVTEVTLRSMAKAVYSEHNIGHFGLAFDWYTHFTSPIRRYPDLVIHRMLHEYLEGMSGGRLQEHSEKVGWISDHSSLRERVAVDAERRSVKIAEVEYLSRHVGDTFDATIISVLPFGMFAELHDLGIEGLIPTRKMTDDYYRHNEKRLELVGRSTGKKYRIGDQVHVLVERVDQINQEIDLALVDDAVVVPKDRRARRRDAGSGPTRSENGDDADKKASKSGKEFGKESRKKSGKKSGKKPGKKSGKKPGKESSSGQKSKKRKSREQKSGKGASSKPKSGKRGPQSNRSGSQKPSSRTSKGRRTKGNKSRK